MRVFFLLICSLSFAAYANQDTNSSSQIQSLGDANSPIAENQSEQFVAWLDEEFVTVLDFSPLLRTRLGDKQSYGELDDVSEASLDAQLAWRRDSVSRMQARFNRDSLDEEGKRSWDLWQYLFELEEQNLPFRRHRYIFGRDGPQSALPRSLISDHSVTSLAHMQAYISRLNQSERYLLQYLARAKLAAAEGIRPPYFAYQLTISEIRRLTTGAPYNDDGVSPLWNDITAKLAKLQEDEVINSLQAERLLEQSRTALLNNYKPANEEIAAWLEADLANVSSEAKGAWALPNGEQYYNARLTTNTTLPLSSIEIHQLGIDEVLRIEAEMQELRNQIGFEGSQQEFGAFLQLDEQFYFPNTDQGRSDYLQLAEQALGQMGTKLADYFGYLPKAGLEVKRVEAFREQAGGSAHYRTGTRDGSRPGVFYLHMVNMAQMAPLPLLTSLAYHEGVPGHHMQLSIQRELEGLPQFRTVRTNTAYVEGWGLYAEYLAKEMGGYSDLYTDYGRLTGEHYRAARLVVDTGIHSLQWSEDEAVEYWRTTVGWPEVPARAEIRRYMHIPGQATSYKIGMLKILELRAKAQQKLGDKFDIKAFHDNVLGSGSLPMPILEAKIDSWINSIAN